jgi:DNA-binding HxlR family transcriptional regulator
VKEILEHINKVFENRVRLAVMSVLMVDDAVEFNTLKRMLNVTDGNLAAHIAALEKHQYLSVRKRFRGKKPLTTYSATSKGRHAFSEHLDALERLIRNIQ